jgi:hypothetical protein
VDTDVTTPAPASNREVEKAGPADQPFAEPEADALVTIVIAFRERWRFTPLTVEMILRNTSGNFRLWLLDSGVPQEVRDALQPYVEAGQLEIIDVGVGRQPSEARRLIASRLATPYAAFVDNDAIVSPDWLDKLVACAEETGAGIVCPLYLWGDRPESDQIHMAGGELSLEQGEGGVRMGEHHRHLGRRISDVADDLCRAECDYGEFHCLLMRWEVYSAVGLFDPEIINVHEHIHVSLMARELGYATWIEPDARVNYLAFAPWVTGELDDFRRRWDFQTSERSLTGFARRWGLADDSDYRLPIRRFLMEHTGRVDLQDARPALGSRRGQPMNRADLQQTFGGLEWLAVATGYTNEEVLVIGRAYRIALQLSEGIYRPCGRPFINHLAGTASVLLFYGCPIPLILAGLLHSVRPTGRSAGDRSLDAFAEESAAARHALALADLYRQRARLLDPANQAGKAVAELPLGLANLYLLDAANDVDMHLSFEVPVSGRKDVMTGSGLSDCQELLEYVGFPGLAATLGMLREQAPVLPAVTFQSGRQGSFRLDGDKTIPAEV